MVATSALWLPIVLSAVVCFMAGFVLWMVMPHHRSDWQPVSDEGGLMDAVRAQGIGPGMYTFPHAADASAHKDPEWVAKVKGGPMAFLVVVDGAKLLNMGPTLLKNFGVLLLMGFMVAYVGSATLPAGTYYLKVFQVTGAVALVGHALGGFPKAIFWGWRWSVVMKEMADGVVYALLTAGVFGWLWP